MKTYLVYPQKTFFLQKPFFLKIEPFKKNPFFSQSRIDSLLSRKIFIQYLSVYSRYHVKQVPCEEKICFIRTLIFDKKVIFDCVKRTSVLDELNFVAERAFPSHDAYCSCKIEAQKITYIKLDNLRSKLNDVKLDSNIHAWQWVYTVYSVQCNETELSHTSMFLGSELELSSLCTAVLCHLSLCPTHGVDSPGQLQSIYMLLWSLLPPTYRDN